MKATKHFESQYLVLTNTGSFILESFRPTDAYEGRRVSDIPDLWKVPYLENVSHDMQVGQKVAILRNFVNQVQPSRQAGTIVAKKQRYWDYSKPIGQREEVVSLSEKWVEMYSLSYLLKKVARYILLHMV